MALTEDEKNKLIQEKQRLESMLQSVDLEKSVVEKYDNSGVSPLTYNERMATSFGNNTGVMNYLKKKGYSPLIRNGEMYVETEKGLTPIDPDFFSAGSFSEVGTDLGEMALTAPEMMVNSIPSALGAYFGAAGGPGGSYLGKVLGGGIGGYLGEKLKQGVGGLVGTYEPDDSTKTNEALSTLIGMGTEAVLPGASYLGKTALKKGGDFLDPYLQKLASNMYLHSTGMNKLIDVKGGITNQQAKQIAKESLDEGIIGTGKTIRNLAKSKIDFAEDALQGQLKNSTSKIGFDELKDLASKKMSDNIIPGDEKAAKSKLLSLLNSSGIKGKFDKSSVAKDGGLTNEWIDSFDLELETANKLKRSFNPLFKNVGKDKPIKGNALMAIQKSLKELIEQKSPDTEAIKKINQKLNQYQQILKGISKNESMDMKRPVNSRTKGIVGAIDPKSLLGYFMMDLMPTTAIESYAAKGLSSVAKKTAAINAAKTPVMDVTSQLAKSVIRDLMKYDVDEEQFNKKRNKSNVD